ncbi:bifunctional dethiobiotin synthetase/adenosylmethionine-8-amino-7-oxononanoate aminotransferase [Biscogniauxia mediterranea]|nr:bifunctional dethiobiotin synthetase/adenosylmethionine-8-amino-7-oxononanoate aminotransferase [Biscogniauxia mediterranea]
MAPVRSLLWRSLRVHQIYGANTDVGKTIFATILCNATAKIWSNEKTSFLKPVSTGPANEADSCHIAKYAPSTTNSTLVQYDIPASPHLAAKASGKLIPSDHALLERVYDYIFSHVSQAPGWLFLETAGGVHSPGPSGTSQADIYAPLRLPVILIGDSKLGGISQTIAAFESLKLRGYDIQTVLLFRDGQYENYKYLTDHFYGEHGLPVATIPQPPPRHENEQLEEEAMSEYYNEMSSDSTIHSVLRKLDAHHRDRISRLETMAQKAHKHIWYPFTQQKQLLPSKISIIDSAHGDYFQVFTPPNEDAISPNHSLLRPAFDGSASWWTQGLGHANPRLSLAASYAAGHYGHVMFAEAIHEPALALAELLLQGMENPKLARVFYTDNGSTGCEVAVKMALRASCVRYGWGAGNKDLGIIGLKGSYHGDTIGAMDCAEPNVFNEKTEWYKGRGFWFDYPTVRCVNGKWLVDVPDQLHEHLGEGAEFGSLSQVFNLEARQEDDLCKKYERYIVGVLEDLQRSNRKFGALVLEPVVLGAGGMILVDPLFQSSLVNVVRRSAHLFGNSGQTPSGEVDANAWTGLPVVFDEVFTGLYRLGRFSAASFLGVRPDISVHAKLLTGGLVPLCATLASESIFSAFESSDKSDALLHGHSYTAHPVGCQVAVESVREMQRMDCHGGSWDWAKTGGWGAPILAQNSETQSLEATGSAHANQPAVWSMWSREFVESLSRRTARVMGVWALGSVLAINVRGEDEIGYKSQAAAALQARLREGNDHWNVHSRVLGNVLYVMASQKSSREDLERLQTLILQSLQ